MNKPKMASATKTRCGGLWVPEEAVTRFPRGAGKGFAGRERKRQRGTRQTPVLRRRGWRKWPVVAGSWSVECRGGGGAGGGVGPERALESRLTLRREGWQRRLDVILWKML